MVLLFAPLSIETYSALELIISLPPPDLIIVLSPLLSIESLPIPPLIFVPDPSFKT